MRPTITMTIVCLLVLVMCGAVFWTSHVNSGFNCKKEFVKHDGQCDCIPACDIEDHISCMRECNEYNGKAAGTGEQTHATQGQQYDNEPSSTDTTCSCCPRFVFVGIGCCIGVVTCAIGFVVFKALRRRNKCRQDCLSTRNQEDSENHSLISIDHENGASRIHSFKVDGRGVFGVAQMSPKIYVSQVECDSISVYQDGEPYTRIGVLQISGMTTPEDMLACPTNGCLYVVDTMLVKSKLREGQRGACVWRIPVNDPTQAQQLLVSEGDWRPRALSLTSPVNGKERLIVTTKMKPPVIYICDLDGKNSKSLPLPHGIGDPEHVIQTSPGTFIMSHNSTTISQIVKLKVDEQQWKMVFAGNPSNTDDLHLNKPEHLARLDDGRILVADFINNRIVLLTPDLSLERELLTRKISGIERPCRLSYDAGKNRLLVALHLSAYLFSIN